MPSSKHTRRDLLIFAVLVAVVVVVATVSVYLTYRGSTLRQSPGPEGLTYSVNGTTVTFGGNGSGGVRATQVCGDCVFGVIGVTYSTFDIVPSSPNACAQSASFTAETVQTSPTEAFIVTNASYVFFYDPTPSAHLPAVIPAESSGTCYSNLSLSIGIEVVPNYVGPVRQALNVLVTVVRTA